MPSRHSLYFSCPCGATSAIYDLTDANGMEIAVPVVHCRSCAHPCLPLPPSEEVLAHARSHFAD